MGKRVLLILAIIGIVISSLGMLQTATARSAIMFSADTEISPTVLANSAPIIDLNGPAPNHNYTTTFTENGGPRVIVSNTMTITDADSTTLSSGWVILTNHPDGDDEFLEIDTANTEISAVYDPAAGKLQLSNSDTISNYRKVLATVTYSNLSDSPTNADRLITFQLFDGENYSNEAISTVLIEAVNDAPILHNDFEFRLSDIDEDDTSQFGNRVSALIDPAETGGEDRISDPDINSLEGIAIIGADSSNGNWQFSTDAGSSWQEFTQLSNSSAILLNPSARIRFLPSLNYHGTTNLTIRAWDQTSGASGEVNVDVSENGGTTAFSKESATVSLEVLAINDPPISDINGIVPGTDLFIYHLMNSDPALIASPQGAINDVDNDRLSSVSVTLKTMPDGASEFLAVETTSELITIEPYDSGNGELRLLGSAPLSEYNRILRNITYSNTAINPILSDRIVEVFANDGIDDGPVSSTTLHLLSSNNAPQIVTDEPLNLSAVIEDDQDPPGNTVAEIISSSATESINDDDGALRGFAIVDRTHEDGQWQFSVDTGKSWHNIDDVSDASAVLVSSETLLRFLANQDAGGFSSELTVRAWDQTSGANGSRGVDVSQNGSNTAFSEETTQVKVSVVAVNDPPLLRLTEGITAVFTEDNGPVNVVGPSLELIDVDNDTLVSATVKIANHQPTEADLLLTIPRDTVIETSYSAESGILSLTGQASVSAYQAVLRAVTFENTSHDPSTYNRIITFEASDALTASNKVSSTMMIEAINDLPLVDLNGAEQPGSNGSVIFDQSFWGEKEILLASNLELQDLDDSTLVGATVTLVNRPDGLMENLSVNTDGTNITASYDIEKGQLQLTGVASLSEYERVLRTASYSNLQERPRTVNRRVRFSARDQEGTSKNAISHIIFIPKLVMFPMLINSGSPGQESDEPNNTCQEAYPLEINTSYQFFAEDRDDWYTFTLGNSGDVIIKLSNYEPIEGQILVIEGRCDALVRIGHNGDFSKEKPVQLNNLPSGNYFIWLITDNIRSNGDPYRYDLTIEVD